MKILILADEANLMGFAKTINKKIDWLKLRECLHHADDVLVEFIIYIGLPPNMNGWYEQREKKLKFIYWLRSNGFFVMLKEGSPKEDAYKANVDVMLAIDAMRWAVVSKPDEMILITGDNDFSYLAIELRRLGINVAVAAAEENLGNELRASSNRIINLRRIFAEFQGGE